MQLLTAQRPAGIYRNRRETGSLKHIPRKLQPTTHPTHQPCCDPPRSHIEGGATNWPLSRPSGPSLGSATAASVSTLGEELSLEFQLEKFALLKMGQQEMN